MSSHHQSELDSTASSPRSDHVSGQDEPPSQTPRVRFMCSFGGNILPRPHDHQLRYVGGETRMVAVNRHTTFYALLSKLSRLAGTTGISVKYQLPNEDLDALISVTTDEDVENMMEEYERFMATGGGAGGGAGPNKAARLRLFLFPTGGSNASSRASSFSSLLEGSSRREWFFEALNGGSGATGLERGRSEASSIVSEVPDYLFGLDNPEEPRDGRLKTRPVLNDNVSSSDPGSPAPRVSSPFRSTSSAPSVPDLPPVRTKPESPVTVPENKGFRPESFEDTEERVVSQQTGYTGNPMWQYAPNAHLSGPQMQPFYYVSGHIPPGNVPVQPFQIQAPYVQNFGGPIGQVPVGFQREITGLDGGMRVVAPPLESYEQGRSQPIMG